MKDHMKKQDEKEEIIGPGVRQSKQEGIDTIPQKVLEGEQKEAEAAPHSL